MITQSKLKELLDYDPETGVFIWKKSRRSTLIGERAGCLNRQNNCIVIWIGSRDRGRLYLAHRLAWLWVHGRFPKRHIDHIDGNSSNNSIKNLREAVESENLQNRGKPKNNKSGFKGVSWHKGGRKWQACIQANGENMGLGLFTDVREAARAYDQTALKLHGKFAKTNADQGLF